MSDPVLTSSYCTNWSAFNTPRLWSMVMNEEDGLAREQVQGWRRLAGSIRSQHQALSTAKADLIAAWPPEQNKSAEAFVNELDRLMARLETAATDADTTAGGLDKILNALDTAKKAIEPIWEKYKDKSDDLVPRWFDGAEDELDDQARNHMITMENAVSDAVADLRVPDPFNFTVGEGGDEWPPPGGGGPGGGGPGSGGSGRLGSGGVSTSVPHDPPPPLPGQDPVLPDFETPDPDPGSPDSSSSPGSPGGPGAVTRPGGPDLAGVINPPNTLPAPIGGPGGPVTGGGPVPGPAPVGGVPPVVPGILPGGGPVPGGRPPISATGRGPVTGRTLPSGAVIGQPGSIGGPGAAGGRGVAGPGATGRGIGGPGGRAGGAGSRPGIGGIAGEPGRGGVAGRGGVGPGLSGVGGPGAGGGRGIGGLRGPGGRGRSGRRDGDEAGGIRPGAGDVEAFGSAPAVGGIGGPIGGAGGVGAVGGRAGGVGAGRTGARAPRPAWLPDDPVGPDRHNFAGGSGGRGASRSGAGDDQPGFDPDNPWQVAEGVNPVINPGIDNDRHDPGPNVIGRRG
ncbi:hypothetical protein JIG36_44080 [Actinoplanes sp. LDG1-06]|uniref:Uncharacterized protein n=1 Tax=Paractinoplanes ovalisporus TaxID=2810368 RepID=A0ABS2ARY6_9ACTN|nr:hypothetical protein [Actinoplanes ovalisporus]MBM2622503.1 hypothetical protein [Actinoplanes ovalisporus]